jgi:hypothetical protein
MKVAQPSARTRGRRAARDALQPGCDGLQIRRTGWRLTIGGSRSRKQAMGTKTWTAVDYDAAKALKSEVRNLEFIELPRKLDVQVVLELDEDLYKILAKNPTWLAKLQNKAMDEAEDAVKKGGKLLEAADKDAKTLDKKAAEASTREIQKKIEDLFDKASDDMAKVAAKLVDDYVKGDKALTAYKRKAWGKIAVTALTVAGGAVLTAVGGGMNPVAWVSVVRGCITVAKELDKLASDTDSVAISIRKELNFLDKWLSDGIDAETKKGKLTKGVREVGLNFICKALNLNAVPSMKVCEEHIALHGKNITAIERESKKFSEGVYAAMDAQDAWAKEFNKAKATQPASAVGKVKIELEKAEKTLDSLVKNVISLNVTIEDAEKENVAFEKAFKALEDGLPGWSKYVDSAVSLGVDLYSGIHEAHSAVDKALSVVSALAQTAADEKLTAKK